MRGRVKVISIIIDGVERFMGNNPPASEKCAYVWKSQNDVTPLVPRDKWVDIDLFAWLPPVYDQDGIGACNAFASVTVLETARNMSGQPYVRLSPGWLYGHINGQQDSGSMLEDALKFLEQNGTCTAAEVGELDWQQRKWGDRTRATNVALGYKILEANLCPPDTLIDSMVSALQEGFVLDAGALWYQSYDPDHATGKIPKVKRGLAGGHAFCVYGCKLESDGVWFRMRNSWTPSWGVNGNALIHESAFTSDIGGVYGCRSASYTGGNVPSPAST